MSNSYEVPELNETTGFHSLSIVLSVSSEDMYGEHLDDTGTFLAQDFEPQFGTSEEETLP